MSTIAQQIKDRTTEINQLKEELAHGLAFSMKEMGIRAKELADICGNSGVGQQARLAELMLTQHSAMLQGILNRAKN